MKISVIVPVFGVEKYIEKCVESLMNQTFEDVEYIFVNDCTKDNSINILYDILQKYPNRQVKVLTHDVNKGLPAARNTGLSMAIGDYIFHCDSDDYLELDALECLYKKTQEEKADIVWCDIYENYSTSQIYLIQPDYTVPSDALKAMLTSNMRFNVWNKLCKRSLYIENKITFLEGNSMGEDMCMMKLFIHAKKVAHIPKALYHYVRCNPSALTKKQTHKKIQEDKNNIESLRNHLVKHTGLQYANHIGFHTLWTKLPLLLTTGTCGQYEEWANWGTEYCNLISELPNANIRLKLLMKMAAKRQWWFIWLHYVLVIKCYYSLRYYDKK